MVDEVPRRTYLSTLLATGLAASVAGCNTSSDSSTQDSTTEKTTAAPNQAPKILAHDATSQDNGTSLAVSLEGEDDDALSLARIEYGAKTVEATPESASVEIDDEFTNLEESTLDTTPGQVTFLLRDTDGKETRVGANPDETAPELQAFAVEPTTTAGEIVVRLEGRDDTGLESVRLRLGERPLLQKNISGQQDYYTEQRLNVADDATFQQNTVTASFEDWNGNTTESDAGIYVRKYDRMEDTRLRPAVEYIPWAGSKFGKCFTDDVSPQPTVGHYEGPPSPGAVNQHIDQMSGFGVERLKLTFNGTDSMRREIQAVLEADILGHVSVEADYPVKDYRWFPSKHYDSVTDDPSIKEEILPRDMGFIKDHVTTRENVTTQDGRPVVTFWGATKWSRDPYKSRIMENYGGYPEFVDDIRSEVAPTGTNPFLVINAHGALHGETRTEGRGWFPGYPDFHALLREFDAVCTWVGRGAEGETNANKEETLDFVKENFAGVRRYTDDHGMEFIPTVFPGFDDRGNTCWGEDRYTPRSTDMFRELLALADTYRTTDLLNVATWNDWTEGTQIEPGTYRNNNYGTAYLELIKEFQQAE